MAIGFLSIGSVDVLDISAAIALPGYLGWASLQLVVLGE
jgi:hypothetical protein